MGTNEYEILYSDNAEYDRHEIYEYIVEKLKNQRAADRIQDAIVDALKYLKKDPEFYPIIGDGPYRKCTIENYIVVHYVDHKNKKVIIEEIARSSQNFLPRYTKEGFPS